MSTYVFRKEKVLGYPVSRGDSMSEMRLDPKIVGEVIAKYRMKKGLTQEVLAGRAEAHPGDALPNQSGAGRKNERSRYGNRKRIESAAIKRQSGKKIFANCRFFVENTWGRKQCCSSSRADEDIGPLRVSFRFPAGEHLGALVDDGNGRPGVPPLRRI